MEDLDPDLVLDMNTLSSLITTKCTSFTGERSFFLDTSCKERACLLTELSIMSYAPEFQCSDLHKAFLI